MSTTAAISLRGLWVDDSEDFLAYVRDKASTMEGVEIDRSTSPYGVDALVREHRYDFVVLDLSWPTKPEEGWVKDNAAGLHLARQLRSCFADNLLIYVISELYTELRSEVAQFTDGVYGKPHGDKGAFLEHFIGDVREEIEHRGVRKKEHSSRSEILDWIAVCARVSSRMVENIAAGRVESRDGLKWRKGLEERVRLLGEASDEARMEILHGRRADPQRVQEAIEYVFDHGHSLEVAHGSLLYALRAGMAEGVRRLESQGAPLALSDAQVRAIALVQHCLLEADISARDVQRVREMLRAFDEASWIFEGRIANVADEEVIIEAVIEDDLVQVIVSRSELWDRRVIEDMDVVVQVFEGLSHPTLLVNIVSPYHLGAKTIVD